MVGGGGGMAQNDDEVPATKGRAPRPQGRGLSLYFGRFC